MASKIIAAMKPKPGKTGTGGKAWKTPQPITGPGVKKPLWDFVIPVRR